MGKNYMGRKVGWGRPESKIDNPSYATLHLCALVQIRPLDRARKARLIYGGSPSVQCRATLVA
jgi:hypothetical protein